MKEETVKALMGLENPVVLLLSSKCLTCSLQIEIAHSEVGLVNLQAGSPAD